MANSNDDSYRDEYELSIPKYQRLLEEVEFSIRQAIPNKIKIHSLGGRVKEVSSFLEKITRKSYHRPFEQMDDLVGFRIVCYFVSDLPRLREAIVSTFEVHEESDKIQEADPSTFGYMSQHYVCSLRATNTGPRYDLLKGTRFEIQCRTILMDAWASVSHFLAYKGEQGIPSTLRRDFHALSGMFHIADRHFELLASGALQVEQQAVEDLADANAPDPELNLDSAIALLKSLYPHRKASKRENVSEFVEEVSLFGYTTISALRGALRSTEKLAIAYEKEHPPNSTRGQCFNNVGIARTALAIHNPEYGEWKYQDRGHWTWAQKRSSKEKGDETRP
ncbi:MAG TPA: hypothetical protein VGE93_23680 [Bryobacteraceae bacterium]